MVNNLGNPSKEVYPLRKSDVIKHFGSIKAVADALNIKAPSVSEWRETIPKLRAYQIEKLTKGKLKVEDSEIYKQAS